MSIMTITPTTDGFSADELDRAAGRADAYDDHAHLTIEQLDVRADYLIDYHPNVAYAQGYSAYVKGAELEVAVSSEEAQTWWARKQGREKSSLHDTHRRPARRTGRAA